MTPTDAARSVVECDNQGFTGTYTRKATVSIARALLDSEAEIGRLRAELQEMAKVTGCLEPDENGRPACSPECVACRQFPNTTGKAGGK